jgi:MFS transporter, ACS family, hexuronate transporter
MRVGGVRGLRWWIALLVFLVTMINFVHRLTVSILAPVITAQLRLTNFQFAMINTWFLVAYALSQVLSGRLYDRIGTKKGFTLSVLVWSTAAAAHAFARGLTSLSCLRFLLGLGEAGNWPGAAKVMAEWFPIRERALGMGIFNSGVAAGSILAPPLIVGLQLRFGWKAAFLVTGGLGLGWLALWQLVYETPARHQSLTPNERSLIQEGRDAQECRPKIRWSELLKHRQVWAILLSRFVTDPVWWLYITWLPLYLYEIRGFSLKQIGSFAWLPYVAAGAGSLIGGWFSGNCIARGWTMNRARKTVIVAGAAMMTAGVLAARVHSAMAALAFIAIVLFGFQSWISNVQTLPSDFFPEEAVASVAGLGGLGASAGAVLFTLATGWVVDRYHSYTLILVIAGLLPLLGTVILFVVGGSIRRVQMERSIGANEVLS